MNHNYGADLATAALAADLILLDGAVVDKVRVTSAYVTLWARGDAYSFETGRVSIGSQGRCSVLDSFLIRHELRFFMARPMRKADL